MTKTDLKFIWKRDSKNDNAIKVLKENTIDWHYDHFLNLVADFYGIGLFKKVDYEWLEDNTFAYCLKIVLWAATKQGKRVSA